MDRQMARTRTTARLIKNTEGCARGVPAYRQEVTRNMNTVSPVPAPPGIPPKLWLVILPNGQRHFVDKEMINGIESWARGTDVIVVEYLFSAVVHVPPVSPKKQHPAASKKTR